MPKNSTITPDRTNRLPPPKNRRMLSMRMSGGGGAGGTDRCVAGAGTKAVELTMVGGAAARGGICTRVESSMRGAGWAGGAATGAARDRLRLRRLRSSSSERKDARMELKSAMAKPATAPSSESRKCDPAFPRVAPANAPMMASTIRMTGSIENSPCKPIALECGATLHGRTIRPQQLAARFNPKIRAGSCGDTRAFHSGSPSLCGPALPP